MAANASCQARRANSTSRGSINAGRALIVSMSLLLSYTMNEVAVGARALQAASDQASSKDASTIVTGTDDEHDADTDDNGKVTPDELGAHIANEYWRNLTLSGQLVKLPVWKGPEPKPACICAFDFDLTLRVITEGYNHTNFDSKALEAPAVLGACQKVPCYIGIASANHNWEKIKKVTTKYYDTRIFTSQFFNSQAFQFGYHNKTSSLLALSTYFQVPTQCMILFDDYMPNKKYATAAQALFENVKNTTGVQMINFQHAMGYLPSKCKGSVQPAESIPQADTQAKSYDKQAKRDVQPRQSQGGVNEADRDVGQIMQERSGA